MAFALGQLIGFVIIVAVIVGLVRTFARNDLSWRDKLFGIGADRKARRQD